MKLQRTLLLVASFAACNVMAQQQGTNSPASATFAVEEPKLHWLAPSRPVVSQQNNREPIEGLSPQAWTTVVGWHPGASAFPNSENYTTELPLLWIGHAPWQ
jgi:hypothetical protein